MVDILPQLDDEDPLYAIDAEDLALNRLQAVVPGMTVAFAEGTIGNQDFNDPGLVLPFLEFLDIYAQMGNIGELAEKPVTVKSTVERLKTRNNQLPGKRTTSIEIRISGAGTKQKEYLENELPKKEITLAIFGTNPDYIPDESNIVEQYPVVFISGLRWTADIMGETDGLWTVVLSTEYQGCSGDRIMPKEITPYILDEEE